MRVENGRTEFWHAAADDTTQHDDSVRDDGCCTVAAVVVADAERCWSARCQGDALMPGPGGGAGSRAST